MSEWDTGLKILNGCGHLNKKFIVYLMPSVVAKIKILMQEFPRIEWLAYYMGDVYWDVNLAIVEDLYIPDSQKNTTYHVDEISVPDEYRSSIIGVIHSHHKMSAVFSMEDWEYLNANNHISTVVADPSGKIDYTTVVRPKTKCGCFAYINAQTDIFCTLSSEDEQIDFINEIKEKIQLIDEDIDELADLEYDDLLEEGDNVITDMET